jgi:hypothetical protein
MEEQYYEAFILDEAINVNIDSTEAFILANEVKKRNGSIGRSYAIFRNFSTFLRFRKHFPHCHEILVNHVKSVPNPGGRLVFDFDLKYSQTEKELLDPNVDNMDDIEIESEDSYGLEYEESEEELLSEEEQLEDPFQLSEEPGSEESIKKWDKGIPLDFNSRVECTIITVINTYFKHISTDKLIFVWSTSENPTKFSRHLTVKNLYFVDWMSMSKCFYKLFCIVWDETENWISSGKFVDFQIVRHNASLRMVGSSKIDGYNLVMDNPSHKLIDSLIRIYNQKDLAKEQIVTMNNFGETAKRFYNEETKPKHKDFVARAPVTNKRECAFSKQVYEAAFRMVNLITGSIFDVGKISGPIMGLLRVNVGHCILSNKKHESENAYVVISYSDRKDRYSVAFGCHRNCKGDKKTDIIGYIVPDTFAIKLESKFESKLKISAGTKK